MKQLKWLNPKKCDINTGYKKFDEQCDTICTGSAYTSTQRSWCIRPWNECECYNKTDFKPGELLAFDLKQLSVPNIATRISATMREAIFSVKRTEIVMLYTFGTYEKQSFTPFGWVLTDNCGKLLGCCIDRVSKTYYNKKATALFEIIPYITNEGTTPISEDIIAELEAQLAEDDKCCAKVTRVCDDLIERTFIMRYYWKNTSEDWKKDENPYITIRRASSCHVDDVVRLLHAKEMLLAKKYA